MCLLCEKVGVGKESNPYRERHSGELVGEKHKKSCGG